MASICCSPPDSRPGPLPGPLAASTGNSSSIRVRAAALAAAERAPRPPARRFSSTVIRAKTCRPSGTATTPARTTAAGSSRSIRRSSKTISPAVIEPRGAAPACRTPRAAGWTCRPRCRRARRAPRRAGTSMHLGRVEAVDPAILEEDLTGGDGPTVQRQRAGHGTQQRGLAGAVAAEHGEHPVTGHVDVHALERLHRLAVTHRQPAHAQHERAPRCTTTISYRPSDRPSSVPSGSGRGAAISAGTPRQHVATDQLPRDHPRRDDAAHPEHARPSEVVPTRYRARPGRSRVPSFPGICRLSSGLGSLVRLPGTGRAGGLWRRGALRRRALRRNPRTGRYRSVLGYLPVPTPDHASDQHADQRRNDQPGRDADGDPSERADVCSSGR